MPLKDPRRGVSQKAEHGLERSPFLQLSSILGELAEFRTGQAEVCLLEHPAPLKDAVAGTHFAVVAFDGAEHVLGR